MSETLWNRCLRVLESELAMQQFNTWVRPLQAIEHNGELRLLAPNRYVVEWLTENSMARIQQLVLEFGGGAPFEVVLDVGTRTGLAATKNNSEPFWVPRKS